MKPHRLGAWAMLVLAACTQAPAPAPAEDRQRGASAPAAQSAAQPVGHEELFGQWHLVEMPGVAPGQQLNIHLLVGRYGIEAVSQCITFGKVLPGAVLPEPPPRREAAPAPVVCLRTHTPVERTFGPMLAAVQSFERLADGRVALRGARGDLVIERTARPVLNPLQNSPGPGPHLMWGEWRIAAIDGSPPPDPMTMLFFRNRLEVGSGCVHFGRYFEQEGPTLRLSPDPTVTTICERMTSPAEDAVERILAGKLEIVSSTPTRRLLRGAGGTLLLER